MQYCKNCGAALPEYAVFCPKCGVENPLTRDEETAANEQAIQYVEQENSTFPQSAEVSARNDSGKVKKPLGIIAWIKENFMPLYVILGVVSYVLLQFSIITALIAYGLGIALAVLAVICAVAFCTVGTIRFFTADVAGNNNKHSSGDIICFALGIIGFIYVLVMCLFSY